MMVMAVSQMVYLVLGACLLGCLRVAPPSVRNVPHRPAAEELQELSQLVALQALVDGQGRP